MAVEFSEEENFNKSFSARSDENSAINNLIIKLGLASDKNGAEIVMVVVSLICFALAIYFATRK